MKTNYQNTGMLDIIFEHRNKAYGAYALRSEYDQRLRQAMLFSFTAIFLLGLGQWLHDHFTKQTIQLIDTEVVLKPSDEVHLKKPEVVEPLPLEKKPQAQAINTVRNPEMKVVQDNQTRTDSLVENTQLQNAESGLATNTSSNALGATDGTGTLPFAEPAPVPPVPSTPVRIAEVMPQFPGGEKALMKYLADNTRFPDYAREVGLGGKVISEFTVNEDGRISDIKILKSPSTVFDREVVRVVKTLPAFSPGMQQGRAVKVRYVLPFTFHVQD